MSWVPTMCCTIYLPASSIGCLFPSSHPFSCKISRSFPSSFLSPSSHKGLLYASSSLLFPPSPHPGLLCSPLTTFLPFPPHPGPSHPPSPTHSSHRTSTSSPSPPSTRGRQARLSPMSTPPLLSLAAHFFPQDLYNHSLHTPLRK